MLPWLVLGSFLLLAVCPLLSRSRTADLAGDFSDHLRHAHVAWLALHKGLAVYLHPFGEVAAGGDYRHPCLGWPMVPYAYPPLALVLFMPVALAGQYLPLSEMAYARFALLYTLVLAHLALWAFWSALGRRTLLTLVAGALGWAMLVRSGLQGFYDPAWLLFGALALSRLQRGRPSEALPWFALAALTNYRAAALAPFALLAAWEAVRGRPAAKWPWASLALLGLSGALCVALFLPVLPYERDFRLAPPLLERGGGQFHWVLILGAGAALLALAQRRPAVAASVAVVTALAVVDTPAWWHALMLLVPLAATVAERRTPARVLLTVVLVCWLLVLHHNVWLSTPLGVFTELSIWAQRLRA
ncbi:hypothetical protein FGE12_02900 [Aggregicoccus sp. 17bor-14]|uniref:hypothetical protein n=1 Tax=Myxococcaceae TaxID=31 RepID=UPI00129CC3FE|nr:MULTISPECIES: hypothetical protein [Myxococcaceae]MBF5041319.1 hypothetical protein [Simulacricoccus sp. 17bor-14]MRI87105.1 hypothetical protein [Aggregicoccus sp. 17bor-14]